MSNDLIPAGSGIAVVQSGIDTGGGDNAARDIHKTFNVVIAPSNSLSKLGKLIQSLKNEAPDAKVLSKHIEALQVFTRIVADEKVIGLDAKLSDGKRVDQIDMAKKLKERIYSELQQNILSPAFQSLYAHLLGKIWTLYDAYVYPEILAAQPRRDVDKLLYEKVIQPMVMDAEGCGVENEFSEAFFRGMIFYLTGNCHVKWQ